MYSIVQFVRCKAHRRLLLIVRPVVKNMLSTGTLVTDTARKRLAINDARWDSIMAFDSSRRGGCIEKIE
jgi:hypothetical protein